MTAGVMRITRAEWKRGKTQQGWPKRSWCQTSWVYGCWLGELASHDPRKQQMPRGSSGGGDGTCGDIGRADGLRQHQQGTFQPQGAHGWTPWGSGPAWFAAVNKGLSHTAGVVKAADSPQLGGPHPGCITQDRREASRPRDGVQIASSIFNRSGGRSDCWKSLMRTALSPSN